ncbi:methionine ABC transporter ATP-binding protein [Oceanobacillus rekensis]|uniref:methionine ABC transporter ATP-binding protein n=1 Tax=Oceanobacillus rekensis TaxID=937927 RepID=UPI000B4537B9|nr:methionine ABC transporter ATP-binding protein [Oceanobacillus rekensis]
MIEIRNLTKVYHTNKREIKGVDNVSITVNEGEVYGIAGYSGAGKSSLLRCINLLEKPTIGKIKVDGSDLTLLNKSDLRLARLKIGMIFQHFNLVSQKTVAENIAFSLKAAKLPKEEMKVRVDELLDMVGLTDKRDVFPGQLSGGQKQRVGIARALANNPKVLLCDEATSALDPTTTKSILNLLKKINRELNITIVIITHEMDVVKDICHRMAIMQDGRVVEDGPVYDVFSNPKEELTKEFISSVVSFEIPETILKHVKGTIVKVLFRGDVAGEGVISGTLKKFNVEGNFLHGSIDYIQDLPLGIFVMELVGESNEIQKALQYIEKQSAQVEVIRNGI